MERKLLLAIVISGTATIILSLLNFLYLSKNTTLSSTLYIVILFFAAVPIIIIKFLEQKKVKELEEFFPLFLRDFVEAVRSGMTVPRAFKALTDNDYHVLTPYVKKISNQLDWGIPVEKVLMKFSKETKSRLIGRIVSSVIEAHRFGGNLAGTFEALSKTAVEVEKLRAERRLYMNSQMITGYIIFFVFLGVMIALGKFLVPSLGQMTLPGAGGVATQTAQSDVPAQYKELFRNLILIQGLFAGLIVGKMAEGAMISGIRHSFIMMFIGLSVFLIFG